MTRTIHVDAIHPSADAIRQAAAACRRGEVVLFPTDTLYGLGTDATNPAAVARVLAVKGRSRRQPMPVLIADLEQIDRIAGHLSGAALALAEAFWPGPLTLIVPARRGWEHVASAKGRVGVRLPAHEVPRRIARLLGRPILGTSANVTGRPTRASPGEILRELPPSVALALDAGPLLASAGSTVLDVSETPLRVLRAGDLAPALLRARFPDLPFADED